jgi:hypothetical protein
VEVTLSNGDVVSEAVTNDVFLILTPVAAEVCEMRTLDANGVVFERIDATHPGPPDPQTPNPCPR